MLTVEGHEFLTVNEAADRLRVHPLTVYRRIKSGHLEALRLEGGNRLRIRTEAVDGLLSKSTEKEKEHNA